MSSFPRALRPKERDLLEFVLPADRPGYRSYRDRLSSMTVLGEGRRGKGNLVLGFSGDPELTAPLTAVIAYGAVETTQDVYSITVREEAGGQIDIEIVSAHEEEVPDHFEEKRRWTYSEWLPGELSPATGSPVREVVVEPPVVLAFAREEKRIWLHDARSGMVHLVPITNFYNELMRFKHIRDPKIALDSSLLFSRQQEYQDADLRSAFLAYNKLRHRVELSSAGPPVRPTRAPSIFNRWRRR